MRIREFFIDEITFIVSLAKISGNLLRLVGLKWLYFFPSLTVIPYV